MDAPDPDSPSRPVLGERRPTHPEIPFIPSTSGSPSGSAGIEQASSPTRGNAAADPLSAPNAPQTPDNGSQPTGSGLEVSAEAPAPAQAVVGKKGPKPSLDLDKVSESQGPQTPVDSERFMSQTSASFLGEPEASLPSGFRDGQYCSPARGGGSAISQSEAEPLPTAPATPQTETSQEPASAGSRLLGHISASVRAEMERIAAAIAPKGIGSSEQPVTSSAEAPVSEPQEALPTSNVRKDSDSSELVKEAIILPPPAEQLQEPQQEVAETAEAPSTSAAAADGTSSESQAKAEPQGSTPNPRSPEKEAGSPREDSPKSGEKQLPKTEQAQDAISPQGVTFAQTLSLTTMQASDRLAEKLIERLQQGCLEEASSGRHYYVFEAALPSSRSFSDLVARAFASRLLDLGFLRFEWWNGKDWREMPGRFCISHNPMYDKYSLTVRVRWPESLSAAQIADLEIDESTPSHLRDRRDSTQDNLAGDGNPANALIEDAVLAPILQHLQQTMALQQQLILQSAAALAAAEVRAERAEQRALAAERTCLEELQKRGQRAAVADEATDDVVEELQKPDQSVPVSDEGKDDAVEEVQTCVQSESVADAEVLVSTTDADEPVSTTDADAAVSDVLSTAATSNVAEGSARATGATQMASARSVRSIESSSDGEDCTEIDSKDLCGM